MTHENEVSMKCKKKFNYDNNERYDEIIIEIKITFYRFATVIHWPMKNAKSCVYSQHKGNEKHLDVVL